MDLIIKDIWAQAGAVGLLILTLVYILKRMEERMTTLMAAMMTEYKDALGKCHDEKELCLEKWMEHANRVQERDAELLAAFKRSNEISAEICKVVQWCKAKNGGIFS